MGMLLLAMTLAAAAPQVEVETLDGQKVVGGLAGLNSQQLTVETSAGHLTLATSMLLRLHFRDPSAAGAPPPAEAWVELTDGSSLAATEYVVRGPTARIDLCGGSTVEVPATALATVRLQKQSAELAAEWSRILDMRHTTDLLVVRSGEVVDYHKGVLRDVSQDTVQFELDGELLPVKRSKVYGLIYYHPPDTSASEPLCQILDAGGSSWATQTLELGDELKWTAPGGVEHSRPVSMIRQIDFSRGKVLFLSDLQPQSVTFTPYFNMGRTPPSLEEFFGLRTDKSLRSGPLQLGQREYEKGLALHSRTQVVYRLPGRFRRFQATAGIDDAVRPRGNVRLVIHGDDRVLLQTTLTGADPPTAIDLDLSGVRRLTILADFGEEMDVADHLDLCEARILK